MENKMNKELLKNAEQIARSTISVIDALAQRPNVFKGEEFSTIGGLRDQCVFLVNQVETAIMELEEEGK